jgi:hypothetical protein
MNDPTAILHNIEREHEARRPEQIRLLSGAG